MSFLTQDVSRKKQQCRDNIYKLEIENKMYQGRNNSVETIFTS